MSEREKLKSAEAIFATWAVRIEGGEQLEFNDLVQGHPTLAAELRTLHEDWQLFAPILGRVVPGLIASGTGLPLEPLPSLGGEFDNPPSDELVEYLGIHTPDEARYRFRAVIGRGGGGVVLKVWDTKFNRPLAMKVVLGRSEDRPTGQTPQVDSRTLSRFVDEARIASQLNHPGIVPVHELGADESGRAFFTMKLVKGDDLSHIFKRVKTNEGGWSLARGVDVLLRVCEAMAYAHDRGVIHRDLKPANVMVGSYGEVHVMDWGLARVMGTVESRPRISSERPVSVIDSIRRSGNEATPDSPLLTQEGSVVGTPSYMSPEQAKGEVETLGVQTDVYSVGAMLYELLAGEIPYIPVGAQVDPRTVLMAVLHGPPKGVESGNPRAAVELVAICEKAMAREKADRYPTMVALADDLRDFCEGRVVTAYETGAWAETRKWVRRNRALAGSLAGTVLVALLGALGFAWKANEAIEQARVADAATGEARDLLYVASILSAQAALENGEMATLRRQLDSAPEEHRNWEWNFLDAQFDVSLFRLEGGPASYSPDGSRIVMTTWDEAAGAAMLILDARSGKELLRLEGDWRGCYFVHAPTFSLDGSRIVTAVAVQTATGVPRREDPCSVLVWDANSGKKIAQFGGLTGQDNLLLFSPGASRILTASDGGIVSVWEIASGKELLRLEHTGGVISAAYSPDGLRIVTATYSDPPKVWDAETGAELFSLLGHFNSPDSVAYSPNGLRIITREVEFVHIWDASSGAEVDRLFSERHFFTSAEFSPDSSRVLVTTDEDGVARIWTPGSDTEMVVLKGRWGRTCGIEWSSDGASILTFSDGEGSVRVWQADSGEVLLRLKMDSPLLMYANFSPDASRILTSGWGGATRVWNAKAETKFPAGSWMADPTDVGSFCPDGSQIAFEVADITNQRWETSAVLDTASGREVLRLEGCAGGSYGPLFSSDGTRIATEGKNVISVWNAITGAELSRTRIDVGEDRIGIRKLTMGPDGRFLAVAWDDNWVRMYDAQSGQVRHQFEEPNSKILRVDFSPDGKFLVTVSDEGVARIWDLEANKQLVELEGTQELTRRVVISPDRLLVLRVGRGGVFVNDLASGLERVSLKERQGFYGSYASFSPDSRLFVAPGSQGNTPEVRSTVSGELLARLEGHMGGIESAVFSPDGTRIVTTTGDRTTRVWATATGTELARFEGPALFAQFSPDGSRLFIFSYDSPLRVLDSVPRRVRYAHEMRVEAAKPEALEWLRVAQEENPDWAAIEETLHGETGLSPLAQEVARLELSRRANAFVLKASRHVRSLRARLFLIDDVIEKLRADPSLDDSLRAEALRVARLYPDHPDEICALLSPSILAQATNPDDRQRAAHAARKVIDRQSGSAGQLMILGAALFRVSEWADALSVLQRASALNEASAETSAFLAMTHFRLGQIPQARTQLATTRKIINSDPGDPSEYYDEDTLQLIAEAEALIEGPSPTGEQ